MKNKLALILNIGSSSIKLEAFEVETGKSVYQLNQPSQDTENDLIEILQNIPFPHHNVAITGHRVVHGGPNMETTEVIDKKVIKVIQEQSQKAPIHNPINLLGITLAQKYFKPALHYACFDTGFFKNLPAEIQTLAIPKIWRDKYQMQKYGFHGLNHQFIAESFPKAKKLVIAHLGNGCSVSMIANQQAKDISMSYSPVSGLIMSQRSGDLDVNIVCDLYEANEKDIKHKLNFESGLLALSQKTPNLKEIYEKKDQNPDYLLAYNSFLYSVTKNIAAFLGQSPKTDLLCFSGGISENNHDIIKEIIGHLNSENFQKHIIIQAKENYQIYNNIIKKFNAS